MNTPCGVWVWIELGGDELVVVFVVDAIMLVPLAWLAHTIGEQVNQFLRDFKAVKELAGVCQ